MSGAEAWKRASGFDAYEVSDIGRVRSVKTGRVLRSSLTTSGYEQIPLRVNGGRKTVLIHRLVLATFVGACPLGHECCHGDGNRLNNRLENLRWDTKAANMADRDMHGSTKRGQAHHNARLTEADVAAIRGDDRTLQEIARDLGVSLSTIGRVKSGIAWAHANHA